MRTRTRVLLGLLVLFALLGGLLAFASTAAATNVPGITLKGDDGFTISVFGLNDSAARWEIYRSLGEPGASQVPTSSAGTLVYSFVPGVNAFEVFDDVGLQPRTLYTYWVFGISAGGGVTECSSYLVRTTSTVWGHVRNQAGAPVPGSTVSLWAWDFSSWSAIATTTSDADGVYGFNVKATSYPYCQVGASDPINEGPTTFLHGGFYAQDGPRIQPEWSGIPANSTITLKPAPARVHGRVVSSRDGSAVASATVLLRRNLEVVGELRTLPDGTFSGPAQPADYTFAVTDYGFLARGLDAPVTIAAGADCDVGTVALTPAWDTPPVFSDPYEPNDTTSTANPIAKDGTVFTGYCDASGTDYISFQARRGKMYHLTVSVKGYGSWGLITLTTAEGTQLAPALPQLYISPPAVLPYTFYGSGPETQTVDLWATSQSDQMLFVGYGSMGATPVYTNLNYPAGALVAYHVAVTEWDPPVIRGRVTNPKSGKPIEGARVSVWGDPMRAVNNTLPFQAQLYQQVTSAADGGWSVTMTVPCSAWVHFDDPNGVLAGEYYNHSVTAAPCGPSPGLTAVGCPPGGVATGIDGYLRETGHVVVRAVRADTGAPVSGARFAIDGYVTDAQWWNFWTMPDSRADGVAQYDVLDPRGTYMVQVWDESEAPATLAGYHFVGFSKDPNFTVSDGSTFTIDARYSFGSSGNVDALPPTTVSDAVSSYVGTATIHLSASDGAGGSGVAHTYCALDGGPQTEGTSIAVAGIGSHTLEYWSEDAVGNVETPHNSVTFVVTAPVRDTTPPTTVSDAVASYLVSAAIHLSATDGESGSGVAHTYYRLDGGVQTEGSTASVSSIGSHTLEFWSVDAVGNVETPHRSVTFAVTALPAAQATSVTIRTAATTARIGATVALSGQAQPAGMVGVNMVVYVMKPGKTYWTYSSNRTVYRLNGAPAWQYKYYFKPGMAKGTYKYKAAAPAPGFASSVGFLTSTSPTTVSIRVR